MSFFQKKLFYFFLLSITTTLPNLAKQDIFREFAKTRVLFEEDLNNLSRQKISGKALTFYIDDMLVKIYVALTLYLEQEKYANKNGKLRIEARINSVIERYDALISEANLTMSGLGNLVEKRLMHLISLESPLLVETLRNVKEKKPYCHLNLVDIFVKVKMINASIDCLIFKQAKL